MSLFESTEGAFCLGVTGHRVLGDRALLCQAVSKALDLIEAYFLNPGQGLLLLSPLAQGADQLVAELVLKRPGARLIVPLPFEERRYMATFTNSKARERFKALVARAERVLVVPEANRAEEEAYEAVGRFVVDNSRLILAVWDGQRARGRGGTGEIVEYARKKSRPLCLVLPRPPWTVRFEGPETLEARQVVKTG